MIEIFSLIVNNNTINNRNSNPIVNNNLNTRPNEIVFFENLINWKYDKTLDSYHWWPMREIVFPKKNNLYCEGGGLYKYDALFKTKSQEYQKENYFRSSYSTLSDAGWAGFCDKASILSCLYKYPQHDVRVNCNNQSVIFKPIDEMLMIGGM